MGWLNYQHLLYFQTIARQGSIAAASKVLRLGSSALSIQLKGLEDFFGQKLFERRSRHLYLTEAGQVVLEYADQIFSLGEELSEVMKEQSFARRLHLRVGVLEGVPKKLIQDLVEAAQHQAPCKITLLEGAGDFLFRELLAHRLDLVLSNAQPAIGDTLKFHTRPIFRSPVSVFGGPDFKKLRQGFPQSLNHQPVLLPTHQTKLRHDLDHYFRIHHIEVDLVMETSNTSVQKMFGVTGLGLIALPHSACKPLVQEGKLIRIGVLKEVVEDFYLVHTPRSIHNPVAEVLMERFRIKS